MATEESSVASTKTEMDALASQLCEEKGVVLAKDKEIKALSLKVRNQEEAGELAATENVSLRGQLKNREEELNDLKDTAETFEAEKAMAVNGVCRWEYPSDHGPMGVDAGVRGFLCWLFVSTTERWIGW